MKDEFVSALLDFWSSKSLFRSAHISSVYLFGSFEFNVIFLFRVPSCMKCRHLSSVTLSDWQPSCWSGSVWFGLGSAPRLQAQPGSSFSSPVLHRALWGFLSSFDVKWGRWGWWVWTQHGGLDSPRGRSSVWSNIFGISYKFLLPPGPSACPFNGAALQQSPDA